LTPTYHILKMYAVHQDAQLIPLKFESPLFEKNGESLPALSLSASKNKDNQLHLSLVNIDDMKSHTVEIDVSGLGVSEFEGEILQSNAIQDHNDFENPEVVLPQSLNKVKVKKGIASLTLPPFSVVVLKGL